MLTKDEMDFVINLIDRVQPTIKNIHDKDKLSTVEKWINYYYNKDIFGESFAISEAIK